MYPAGKVLVGIVAVGLVAVLLMGTLVGTPVEARNPFAAETAVVAPSAPPAAAHTASSVAPSVHPDSTTVVTVKINTVYGGTTSVPAALSFTVGVTNGEINNVTTTIAWTVNDTVTGAVCTSGIFNYLLPAANTASFTSAPGLSLANFSTAQLLCPNIATDVDELEITATVNGTGSGGTVANATGSATTSFTLPTTIALAVTSTIPAVTTLPLTVSVKVTVTDAVITPANLTIYWEVGYCAVGSFSYLVTSTASLTETVTGPLSLANFSTSNLNPGCAAMYLSPLPLNFTGTIDGTGNWATANTSVSSTFVGPTSVYVSVSTALPTYSYLASAAIPVDFGIQVGSVNISTTTTSLWVNITDEVTLAVCASISLNSLVSNVSGPFASYTYNFALSSVISSGSTGLGKYCPNILSDPVELVIGASVLGTTFYGAQNTASDSNTTATTPITTIIFTVPAASFNLNATATPYTYNVSAVYSGQFVGRVALTIYSATLVSGTRPVIFSTNLYTAGSTSGFASWYEPKAGSYPYTLQVLAPYGNTTYAGVLALTATTLVYTNTTYWYNTTSFGGLSPAVGGTILLVVGLIIGMIVALLLGAALFRRRETTPPQAWEASQGGQGGTGGSGGMGGSDSGSGGSMGGSSGGSGGSSGGSS